MSCAGEAVPRSESSAIVRRLGLSWPILLGAAAFVLALAGGAVRFDPDAYWQIATGRWILAHGYVPTHDLYSFTLPGAPWIVQEWGAELLMNVVYGLGGWQGLGLLCAALFGLTIGYLARFLLARMEPLHALLLTVLAACMMFSYIIVRPYEIVWPLTALWVGGLIESRERRGAPPWWLLGVMLIWANLHGSFILGLGVATVIAVEAIVDAKGNRMDAGRKWGAFIAAAFGCAMLNPQGYRLLLFPFHLLGLHVLSELTEWQQPSFQGLPVFGLWLLSLLALAFSGRVRLPLLRSMTLLALIYMALQHVRNVSLLGFIAPLLIASPLADQWKKMPARRRNAEALDRGFRALARPGKIAALCATLVIAGALGFAVVAVRKSDPPGKFTPRAALDVLLADRPDARIFNDYNFGGYLIFRGVPVFVDGRADMYGDRFLEPYFAALRLSARGNIGALLKKYRINAILMSPQWPVVRLLDRMPHWKRVYADKVAVVYLRSGAPS